MVYIYFWLFFVSIVNNINCGSRESTLKIGKSINIFVRYGYMATSMRVIPNDDKFEEQKWLFREPSKSIFKNLNGLIGNQEQNKHPVIFHGDFHMELCDNRRQLYQAYFRDFTIDLLDKPWETFTGGWHPENAAKKLGINTQFALGDYSYVLVRVVRFRESNLLKSKIPLSQPLEDNIRERKEQLQIGNVTAAIKFLESFGTHYVNSYTTGNSLYQVFVYNRKNYQIIKNSIKDKGINGLSKSDFFEFFAPWFSEHLGKIRSASANGTVERWAQRHLHHKHSFFSFQSLLVLHGNGTLLRSLDNLLRNEAILQLDLKSLSIIFRDNDDKQKWFNEIFDNHKKLWEVNLP